MDEPTRKRPTPARDSLDILRRIEPVLLRAATDVVTLRQTLADLSAPSRPGRSADMDDGVERLTRGLDDLARTHESLREVFDRLAEGQSRLNETQERLRLEQGRLAQGWARQEDGQERLHGSQGELLDGVTWLRDSLSHHHADGMATRNAVIGDLRRLREMQQRMAEDQALYFEGQKALGDLLVQLADRVRLQGRHLQTIRREMRFLPVLWVLAALVFAAAGAAVVVLRVHLS